MNWFDNATVYHIFPLGYVGASDTNDYLKRDGKGGILNILPHLPVIKAQGFTTIFFGPVFQSGSHGYDVTDYFTIDSRIGTNEEFKEVCDKIHELGMYVILDGVFNHVGRDFAPFKDVIEKKIQSEYCSWFHIREGNSAYNDGFGYECWEGHPMLVKLNLYNGLVKDYLKKAVTAWFNEFHIDGLRLDVAYCLELNFLKELRLHCKGMKKDFWLLGETIHGDYNKWMNPEMLDSVTNYECYKGMFSSFNDLNLYEIAHSLNRQFGGENWCLYTGKKLYCFVDNHDVSRIASQLKNKGHLKGIYTLLFTMPGIPGIYYGSEYGIEAEKQRNSDANLRPRFMVEDYKETSLTKAIAKLAAAHRDNPPLYNGSYQSVSLQNRSFAFVRRFSDKAVYSLINADEHEVQINLSGTGVYENIFTGEKVDISQQITLPPYETMVLI